MGLASFDDIVSEHGAVVLRVCRALLDPDAADDAWSETFLSAFRAYPDLPEGSNVRGWLVTIAHRRSIDRIRSAARAPVPSVAAGAELPAGPMDGCRCSTPDGAEDPWDPALVSALLQLPKRQREAVLYRHVADLAYQDVADLLACSQAAARRRVADGLAALRRTYPPGGTR